LWKSELIGAIEDVAVASVAVVKYIQEWRALLWRPHAFIWNGVNYLIKMSSDMKILERESLGGLLSSLPISPLGMLCVTFDQRRVEEVTSQLDDGDQEALRLKVTVLTVIREPDVQAALAFEKTALKEKGAFIPTLRLMPSKLHEENNQRDEKKEKFTPSSTAFSYLDTKTFGPKDSPFDELTSILSENKATSSVQTGNQFQEVTVASSISAFDELSSILGDHIPHRALSIEKVGDSSISKIRADNEESKYEYNSDFHDYISPVKSTTADV
jgi:hypothetical protein